MDIKGHLFGISYPRALKALRAEWNKSRDEIYTFTYVFFVIPPGWNKYARESVQLTSRCSIRLKLIQVTQDITIHVLMNLHRHRA
jgi:hypothetical protein